MLYRPMVSLRDFFARAWRQLPPWLQQFGRYATVGFINMAIFYSLFNIFLTARWPTLRAYVLSLSAATVNSFFWNKFWAFRDISRDRLTQQFALFVLWSVLTIALSTAAVWLLLIPLAKYGRLGRNLAALLVGPISVAANFVAYRRWTFAVPSGISGVGDPAPGCASKLRKRRP
jgi:putative flippase GtrA